MIRRKKECSYRPQSKGLLAGDPEGITIAIYCRQHLLIHEACVISINGAKIAHIDRKELCQGLYGPIRTSIYGSYWWTHHNVPLPSNWCDIDW